MWILSWVFFNDFKKLRLDREGILEKIAETQRKAFPDSLSSKMGIRYIKAMLSWYFDSPQGFIFWEMKNENLVGYCGGIIRDQNSIMGSASSMAQHSFNAAVLAFLSRPWLFFHTEMIGKYGFVFRNLWYKIVPRKRPPSGKLNSPEAYTGLVVIGVDPKFQGQGIGQKLLAEFESRTKGLGIGLMRLSVVKDNAQAIGAYKKSGWEIFSNDGKSVGMQKRIA